MRQDIRVWDTGHQFGVVEIASFSEEKDAVLFVKAKSVGETPERFWFGKSLATRQSVSIAAGRCGNSSGRV